MVGNNPQGLTSQAEKMLERCYAKEVVVDSRTQNSSSVGERAYMLQEYAGTLRSRAVSMADRLYSLKAETANVLSGVSSAQSQGPIKDSLHSAELSLDELARALDAIEQYLGV